MSRHSTPSTESAAARDASALRATLANSAQRRAISAHVCDHDFTARVARHLQSVSRRQQHDLLGEQAARRTNREGQRFGRLATMAPSESEAYGSAKSGISTALRLGGRCERKMPSGFIFPILLCDSRSNESFQSQIERCHNTGKFIAVNYRYWNLSGSGRLADRSTGKVTCCNNTTRRVWLKTSPQFRDFLSADGVQPSLGLELDQEMT